METQGTGIVGVEQVSEFNDPLSSNSKELVKVPNLINEEEPGKLQERPAFAALRPEQWKILVVYIRTI